MLSSFGSKKIRRNENSNNLTLARVIIVTLFFLLVALPPCLSYFSSILSFTPDTPLLVSAQSTPIWPTFQHDPQRSSLSPYTGPSTNSTDWVFGPTAGIIDSPVIGSDGTVYVVDSNHTLYAINPDGALEWEQKFTENLFSPVIGPSGTIYVPGTRYLYAFNPDGTPAWTAPYDISTSRGAEIAVSPTGIIFEIDSGGTLHAINPLNSVASSIWTLNLACIPSSLALSESGDLYCGTGENGTTASLYSINPNGQIMWSFPTKSPVTSPPAIDESGNIYAISSGGEIFAISSGGDLLWTVSTVHAEQTPPIIGSDGTIYVGGTTASGSTVESLSNTKSINWSDFCFAESNSSLCIPFDTVTSMAIDSDSNVYVGTNSSGLFALNSQGGLEWSYSFGLDEGADSPLAIGSNGTIYVGTSCLSCNGTRGYVYAVGRPSGYSPFSVSESGLPAGASWSFSVDGANYTTSASTLEFSLPSGNFDWIAPPSEIYQRSGVRYASSVSNGSVDVPSVSSLNFKYSIQYELNFASSPILGGNINQSSGWYRSGSVVSTDAFAANAYQFASWQTTSPYLVISNSRSPSTNIVVNGPGTVFAAFSAYVTLNAGPGGSLVYNDPPLTGTVNSRQSASFYASSISIMLLTAIPAPGYNFEGWVSVNGSGFDTASPNLAIQVRNPMSFTAQFVPILSASSTSSTHTSTTSSTITTVTSTRVTVSVPNKGVLPLQNWGLIFVAGISVVLLILLGVAVVLSLRYTKKKPAA